jgi:hypothetical protein
VVEESGLVDATGPGFVMGTQMLIKAPHNRTFYAETLTATASTPPP